MGCRSEGRLKSSQPHLLTVAAATLQSKSSRDRQPGGLGLPRSGWEAGGRGAGRPTSAILAGERTTLHRVPSLPARPGARIPPNRWKPDQPENPGRAGELGSPEARDLALGRG